MAGTSYEERRELRSAVRAFVTKRSSEAEVRATMASETGYDPDLWNSMAVELGLQGMALPEEHGGAGAGWVELGVVFEELGRALVCAPMLATVGFAVSVLEEAGDSEARSRWYPAVAAGECVLTAGITGSEITDTSSLPLTAELVDGIWRVTGTQPYVLDGSTADAAFLLARTVEGACVFEVRLDQPGARTEVVPTSDRTRRFASLHLDAATASMVGTAGTGIEVFAQARDRAAALVACEQTGGASVALDMAVEYAKTRVQFDRPIGSFQAVKHRCADMLVAVESARAASWAAVRAVDERASDLRLTAAASAKICSQSFITCASGNVQVHGGIGFTFEHPAHLYVKRSRGSAVLLGSPHDHRRSLNQLISQFSGARRIHRSGEPERNEQ